MSHSQLTKKLMTLHHAHGFRADQYFNWLVDDCLAGFGRRLLEAEIPPEKVRPEVFDLGQVYAQSVKDSEPFADVLGDTYQVLASEFGSKNLGQYFTPRSIAMMMAQLQGPQNTSIFQDQPLVRFADIGGCGSGALLLAAAATVLQENPDGLPKMSLTGVDLDVTCAKMFPAQMLGNCLLHQLTLGEVISYHGNGLASFNDWTVVVHASARSVPLSEVPAAKSKEREAMVQQVQKSLTKEDQISLPI